MMTSLEAAERARQLWGPSVVVTPHRVFRGVVDSTEWWVEDEKQTLHSLDGNGHVTCHHDVCLARERDLP